MGAAWGAHDTGQEQPRKSGVPGSGAADTCGSGSCCSYGYGEFADAGADRVLGHLPVTE